MARHVFKGKVHIGYLAGIVAASNAGGAGSVVGDTTTTMMWIDGISPLAVVEAYIAAAAAFFVFGIPAAHPAAPLFADPQGRAARLADRLSVACDRRADSRRRDRRQRHRQSEISRACSTWSPCSVSAVWVVILLTARMAAPRLGDHARDVQGHVCSCWRS